MSAIVDRSLVTELNGRCRAKGRFRGEAENLGQFGARNGGPRVCSPCAVVAAAASRGPTLAGTRGIRTGR